MPIDGYALEAPYPHRHLYHPKVKLGLLCAQQATVYQPQDDGIHDHADRLSR